MLAGMNSDIPIAFLSGILLYKNVIMQWHDLQCLQFLIKANASYSQPSWDLSAITTDYIRVSAVKMNVLMHAIHFFSFFVIALRIFNAIACLQSRDSDMLDVILLLWRGAFFSTKLKYLPAIEAVDID